MAQGSRGGGRGVKERERESRCWKGGREGEREYKPHSTTNSRSGA